jgi:hypothetical protein
LEQVCFQEENRRMRTRMSGGVRGVRSNAAPISILVRRIAARHINHRIRRSPPSYHVRFR